ncbi:histidine phosphatase family protein [Sedimentitalea todarodis]|uniref:Histidine phosphatase family protein n=1 Tax=Sedimentitalea todarodis TaxID=1631240 RepID=A0ABU3VD15_9RHOB|nr:histidine phosphatase family protein [Sedimentitalea todarodis]MDU9004044.1 histidine phosphatase family protein [Sedimentitalea todarodis]
MDAKTVIYLFRHGETDWNTQGRRQGHLDSPLTQRGRLQAEENAMRLRRHLSLDGEIAVFASPLGRARHTALIMVKDLGLSEESIIFEPRLKECSFGIWEGLTTSEIKARYPQEWHARSEDKWTVPAPSGESYADVHARVSEWYEEVSLAKINLVVCHGLTSRVFRGIHADLSRHQVFALKEPQDGFFELHNQTEVFIE